MDDPIMVLARASGLENDLRGRSLARVLVRQLARAGWSIVPTSPTKATCDAQSAEKLWRTMVEAGRVRGE